MELEDALVRQAIRSHLKSFWPASSYREESWPSGPILRSIPHFRVGVLAPKKAGEPHVYCSIGFFAAEASNHIRHEFLLLSPSDRSGHVEKLAWLADFHANELYRLDTGRIVDIGESWMEGSTCDHFLMSLPYPFGPKLEWLRLETVCIRFLWALPITAREAAFAEINGVEALQSQFDSAGINYLDPQRCSVV